MKRCELAVMPPNVPVKTGTKHGGHPGKAPKINIMKILKTYLLIMICLSVAPYGDTAQGAESPAGYTNMNYEWMTYNDCRSVMNMAEKEIRENPASENSYAMLGMAYFYSGNYKEAAAYLQKAVNINPLRLEIKNKLEFAAKTRDIINSYETNETEHFIFRAHPRDGILKYYAIDSLEESYEKLAPLLGFNMDRKIVVEIYSTRDDFNYASTLTKKQIEVSGAIGICKFNRIMIVSPRCLAFGFRWLDSLAHELVHYMILHTGGPDTPLWLNEGAAKYYETIWRSEDSLYLAPLFKNVLAEALEKNQWVTFSKMRYGMPNLDNNKEVTLAFAEAAAGVDYIISSHDTARLTGLIREFMNNKDENKVFKKTIGVSSVRFFENLKNHLKTLKLTVTKGVVFDNYKLKDEKVNEIEEYVGLETRGYVLLGDKFKRDKAYKVALIEYEKGLKQEPENSVILDKMGKTYFDMGNYLEAENKLRESLKYNPNSCNTYLNLGELLIAQNRLDEALKSLEQSNQINPYNPLLHREMGIILFNKNRKEDSIKEFKITLMLDPYDNEVRNWLK